MKAPRRRAGGPAILPPPQPAPASNEASSPGAARGFRQVARSHRQTQRAAAAALWALVISGPLLGLAALAEHASPQHAAATASTPADTTGAAGVAELYLEAFLSAGQGGESSVRVYYPAFPDQAQPSGQRQAEAVAVISSRATSPGVVAVVLAAHVVAAQTGGGWADQGWHYYQVAMAAPSNGGGYLALGLPAEIQAPAALALAPNSGYTDSDAPTSGTPLAAAVQQFLQAYLTGQGVVSRYTTATSTLAAISPAPYTSVQLTGLATDATSSQDEANTVPAPGTVRHVLATVTAVDALGHDYTLAYPLTLATVAGQWEIASLAPAPATSGTPSASQASPAAAGSTASANTWTGTSTASASP